MFKILLLNPPFLPKYSRQSRSPCVTKGGTIYYPYYLAYATGVAEQAGFDARFVDGVTRNWSHSDAVSYAEQYNPNLIVLESSTPSIMNDLEVARKLKEALPNSHITMVNTHPTNMPDWTLNTGIGLDSVCKGEYDYTVRSLAQHLETGRQLNTVNGLSFKEKGKVIHNGPADLIENLDTLPFISELYMKHLGEAEIKKYFYASITWPEIQILTARGCPYTCGFCNIPMKKSYRARSVKNVLDEFEYIKNEMPFLSEVMLEDDTFPIDKKRTLDICNGLVERKINVIWSCNARVNTDTEVMHAMKKAGCRLLCVGFESPTQSSLNGVTKGQTGGMEKDFMKSVNKTGLLVNGCFILGLPSDTEESMKSTIEFAKELNPNTAQFYPLMVYPGTASYKWAKESGYLSTEDFSQWLTPEGLHYTVVSRPGLSKDELLRWCNKARLEFYTNPKYIGKMIAQAALHPREAVRIAKGGKSLFKYMLKYLTTDEAEVLHRQTVQPHHGHEQLVPVSSQKTTSY